MADTTFLYLFRGGENMNNLTPDEMQRNMQKWGAWIEALSKEGRMRAGDPLEPSGKVVTGKSKTVTDGVFAEAKDVVGGYLIVAARDIAHATELSRGCPIFESGGSVEVRGIRPMTP
jgi:hypothetical protein